MTTGTTLQPTTLQPTTLQETTLPTTLQPTTLQPTAPAGVTRPRAGTREWLGLAVLSLAVLLIAVDATVLDVALPHISEHLAPSSTQLLWIIDIYSFVLAGLLVTMGTLGDRIGRRRLLLLGATGFGLASLVAAFSVNPTMLIAARVLQGISGATLMPATLATIRAMFADSRQRATAIGVWGAMWGGGAAAGPLLGGWLLEHFWWGSVFLVNLPVMLILLAAAPALIPESRDPNPGRLDPSSVALSMLALFPLIYAIKETAAHGPSWSMAALAGLGLAAGWGFIRRQRRLRDPLVELRLFAVPRFSTAIITNLLAVFALAGVVFFGAQYLQLVLGLRPLQAGLLMLPGMVANVAGSLLAAPIAARFGNRSALVVPLLLAAAGALVMVAIGSAAGVGPYVAGFTLIGFGTGVALTLTSAMVVDSVEPARAGAASAISETAYELGGAIGVAVLGSVVMAVFRGGLDVTALSASDAVSARETLGGALTAAHAMPADAAAALTSSAQEAFVSGAHVALIITAALLVAVAGLAARLLRRGTARRG